MKNNDTVKVKDLFKKDVVTVDKKKFNDAVSYYEEVKKKDETLTLQFSIIRDCGSWSCLMC